MYIENTSCCAVEDINGLSDHDTPEEAMEEFCEHYYDGHYGPMSPLPGLILFTAVVGYTDNKAKPSYGPNFKAFILKHRLGSVVESPLTTNRQNHPNHQIKAWLWRPNQKALQAWMTRVRKANPDHSDYI